VTFFYWFYQRFWFAKDAEIELLAFFTILGFVILSIVTVGLCIDFARKDLSRWRKVVIPLVVITFTFPAIDLYGTMYNVLSKKAFVRIINDSKGATLDRFWSANLSKEYFKRRNKYVIHFDPVYNYDFESDYSGMYWYEITPVYFDLMYPNDSIVRYSLPDLSRGDCVTIRASKLTDGEHLTSADKGLR